MDARASAEAQAGKPPAFRAGPRPRADFMERRRNYAQNMMEGRIASMLVVAEKPR